MNESTRDRCTAHALRIESDYEILRQVPSPEDADLIALLREVVRAATSVEPVADIRTIQATSVQRANAAPLRGRAGEPDQDPASLDALVAFLRSYAEKARAHETAALDDKDDPYALTYAEFASKEAGAADGWADHVAHLTDARAAAPTIHGVTWLLIRDGCVLLERCEKKARVLGVGEWFVPGGKIEGTETPDQALRREIKEEWPGVDVLTVKSLPIIEGSPVPPAPRKVFLTAPPHGAFLMRPYLVTVSFDRCADGTAPDVSSEGVPLRWTPIAEALASPVLQVRMMVAAAMEARAATSAEPVAWMTRYLSDGRVHGVFVREQDAQHYVDGDPSNLAIAPLYEHTAKRASFMTKEWCLAMAERETITDALPAPRSAEPVVWVEKFLAAFYAADKDAGFEGWENFSRENRERLRANAMRAFNAIGPSPQVAALREEVDQLRSELKSWRGVARNEKAEHERLSAALEAAKQAAAQVEEDDLLVFLDDTFSGGNEIRFVPTREPVGDRTEERDGATIVWVDDPPSINEFGDTERPHETLSDALRDWYKRDARPVRAALPSGDATR